MPGTMRLTLPVAGRPTCHPLFPVLPLQLTPRRCRWVKRPTHVFLPMWRRPGRAIGDQPGMPAWQRQRLKSHLFIKWHDPADRIRFVIVKEPADWPATFPLC